MPRIVLTSYSCQVAISTTDLAKIGPWLEEWLPRLHDGAVHTPELRLEIFPLWLEGWPHGQADWPRIEAFSLDRAAIRKLRTALGAGEGD